MTEHPGPGGDAGQAPAPPGYGVSAGPRPTAEGSPHPGGQLAPAVRGPVYGPVRRHGQVAPPAGPSPSHVAWPPPAPPAAGLAPLAPPAPLGTGSSIAWGPPGQGGSPQPTIAYASWSRRALGWLVDFVPTWVGSVLVVVAYLPVYAGLFRGDFLVRPSWSLLTTGTLLSVAALGWTVYNRWFLAGRTGQSLGRRVTRTYLVDRATGRPVGTLVAFVRDLLHVLDRAAYVGYLWPLWDDERQTLADKVALTLVVRTPVAPLAHGEPTRPV